MSKISDLTLLYVEDDTQLREQFVRILRPRFKKVYEASDGEQALEKYHDHAPDMMLVDINLPKINGLEVVESVRNSNEDIPIVILSAYSDKEKLLRAITLGLSQYLVKPVPHKKLLSLFEVMALTYEKKIDDKNIILLQNDYFWRKEEKVLVHKNERISLTKRERILLEFLIQKLNVVATIDSITNLIWEDEEFSSACNSLKHLLKRLRKKLPEELIENIYGEGYKILSV